MSSLGIRLPIAKGVGLGLAALLVLLIASPPAAEASHITHLTHRWNLDTDPGTDEDYTYTAAMVPWALESRQANFCIDGNFTATAFSAFRSAGS